MSLRLDLLDSTFAVDGPPRLLEDLGSSFTCRPADHAVAHRVRVDGLEVVLDDEPAQTAPDAARLLETVLMVVNAAVIADIRCFAVHAGVVARHGVAVAWPGVSGAGKTTLTAACLQAGFTYVSDEALALQDGRARPYLKPLSLSAWSLEAVGLAPPEPGTQERPVPPAGLGAAVAEAPVPLGHLVVLARGRGPARLEPVAGARAAMLLLEHSFNHYRLPAEAFAAATAAAANASCWTLHYDRPSQGAEALRALTD